MQVLHITTEIPPNRRVTIDMPKETPVGLAHLEIRIGEEVEAVEVPPPQIDPRLIRYCTDPVTGKKSRIERTGVVREVPPNS